MCRMNGPDAGTERQKLETALKRADLVAPTLCDDSRLIIEAARKHLDTLPVKFVGRWDVTYTDAETAECRTWTSGWRVHDHALDSAKDAMRQGKTGVSTLYVTHKI